MERLIQGAVIKPLGVAWRSWSDWRLKRQKGLIARLEQEFLSDQALYHASRSEQLMRGILEEMGLFDPKTAYVWSSPCFTPEQPNFIAFGRFDIRRIVSPDALLLPDNTPVQTFAEVRIIPDGHAQTLMILAAGDGTSVLGVEEWPFEGLLRDRLTLAIKNPNRKLVRRFEMLSSDGGHDAYGPFFEAEEDLPSSIISPL
ncbi:hypothetical protein HYW41_02730 [Candidatus Daviesbacteria bacterium]|nr:hypothetical protein [Candidatus Daviesbacteria bacterium]